MTHLIIKTTANGALSSAALVEESNQCLFGARTFIILDFLSTAREELDGGVRRHFIVSSNSLVRLCIRVNVGNNTLRKSAVNDKAAGRSSSTHVALWFKVNRNWCARISQGNGT